MRPRSPPPALGFLGAPGSRSLLMLFCYIPLHTCSAAPFFLPENAGLVGLRVPSLQGYSRKKNQTQVSCAGRHSGAARKKGWPPTIHHHHHGHSCTTRARSCREAVIIYSVGPALSVFCNCPLLAVGFPAREMTNSSPRTLSHGRVSYPSVTACVMMLMAPMMTCHMPSAATAVVAAPCEQQKLAVVGYARKKQLPTRGSAASDLRCAAEFLRFPGKPSSVASRPAAP